MSLELLREHGYYGVTYRLVGATETTLADLKERLLNDHVRYTGWGPFWFPTRPEIAPKAIDERTYQCVHEGGRTGHVEKWRATTDGIFTLIRAHDLDEIDGSRAYINLILPVWRIAEIMLHSQRMGVAFEASEVEFSVLFTGLSGRQLTTKETPGRLLAREYRTHANDYEKAITVSVESIDRQVASYTEKLLVPFYSLFEFVPPATMIEDEVKRMRQGRY